MLNAPGAIIFVLRGGEQRLGFTGGLLPGAYTDGGESDGVSFAVDATPPGQATQRVFLRHLDPRANAGDRGSVNFEVKLPAFPPGMRLRLATGPGPSGSEAWDWSYLERVHLE